MNNPSGPGDRVWEWIEVRNTDTVNPVDLKGYLGVNLNDNAFDPNATFPDATVFGDFGSGPVTGTVIPAGGVAILYDGFEFSSGFDEENFDPNGFYQAWGLDPNVTVVMPTNFWPGLSNSAGSNGQTIAFYAPDPNFNSTLDGIKVSDRWPTYLADVTDTNPDPNIDDFRVTSFANSAFSLDYRDPNSFAVAGQGESVHYIGTGDITDGANWALSAPSDASGAYTSLPVAAEGQLPKNSGADIANPGTIPGSAPTGLAITEILYDSSAFESGSSSPWEWVEIYNGTGSAIVFGSDPNYGDPNGWVFDDQNTTLQSEANIFGTLAAGEVGILFNADETTAADFLAAWDPNGDIGLNLLAVSGWTNGILNNGGDSPALWESFADYSAEDPNGTTLTQGNAVVSVDYSSFDIASGGASIYLGDASLDPSDPNFWVAASLGDIGNSFNATEVFDPNGTTFYHEGGDIGSPGTFIVQSGGIPGDFDNNGRVDAADFLAWQRNPALGDLADWEANYGTPITASASAVPEPSTLFLVFGSLASLGLQRRRQS